MLNKLIQTATDQRIDLIPNAQGLDGGLLDGGSNGFFGNFFGNSEFFTSLGIFGFLATLWSVYTIVVYIVCIIFLVLYVYASIQKNLYANLQTEGLRDAESLYDEKYRGVIKNNRLADVLNHSSSENPNDWKLAIIEADIILDDLLKKQGFAGNSLGERLKSVSPNQINSLNDAWEAHKVRNRIAHDGADFVLTKHVAQETISRYQRVFSEFDIV